MGFKMIYHHQSVSAFVLLKTFNTYQKLRSNYMYLEISAPINKPAKNMMTLNHQRSFSIS